MKFENFEITLLKNKKGRENLIPGRVLICDNFY